MLYDKRWDKPVTSHAAATLIAARELIEDEANWLNRQPTDDEQDNGRHCSITAIHAAGYDWRSCSALLCAMGMPVPEYNDTHTHAEVLAKFDAAIAAC
jgi:hypothetical protein